MPIGFDVNEPIRGGVNTIQAIIDQYASPEAAMSDIYDNSRGGYDYLQSQYQSLSGDAFADPFEDASRARSSALTAIAPNVNRPIIATGSNMGQRAIPSGIDPNMAQVVAQARGEAATPFDAEVARLGAGQPNLAAAWSHPAADLDRISDPTSPDYLNAQKTRVSSLGTRAMSLFQTLKSRTPAALAPTSRVSPRLQMDEKGKPIAGDVLNADLFSHPDFQKMLREEPDRADKFYEAVTGRALKQDISIQLEANKKRQGERDKVLSSLSHKLDFDEMGEPFIREYVAGLVPGERQETRRPLSLIEKKMIEQEGGFKSLFGFPPPGGPPELGKATPKAREAIKSLVAQDKTNDPISTKIARAKKQLFPPPPDKAEGPGKLLQAGVGISNLMRSGVNVPVRMANELLRAKGITGGTSEGFLPTFGDIDVNDVASEWANRPPLSDVLAQTHNYWSQY